MSRRKGRDGAGTGVLPLPGLELGPRGSAAGRPGVAGGQGVPGRTAGTQGVPGAAGRRNVRLVVEADGGSRGNPGPAGYGAVVRDPASGAVLAERHGGLGTTTNNVAEYRGLIAGLQAAAELGATELDVRMDSKLVVEQMSGRWKVRHPGLQPLASQAAGLVEAIGAVRFEWIPRSANKAADALANRAMDAQATR